MAGQAVDAGLALALLVLSVLSATYPTWNPWTHPWLMVWLYYMGWVQWGGRCVPHGPQRSVGPATASGCGNPPSTWIRVAGAEGEIAGDDGGDGLGDVLRLAPAADRPQPLGDQPVVLLL